jgi:hypothetical protein
MNNDPADLKLQRFFEGLKADDARAMPAFDELASGRRAALRTTVRWGRIAAAATVLLVLGAMATLLGRNSASVTRAHSGQVAVSTGGATSGPTSEFTQWTAVSAWRASTDSLLTDSGLLWGSGITAPTDSLIKCHSVSGETDAGSNKGKEAL